MSEPVTNAEVEDVLSSIRRLVSEDKRPVQSKLITPVSDRLLLTPALRVSEDGAESTADTKTETPNADAAGDAELSQIKAALTGPIATQELDEAKQALAEETSEVLLTPLDTAAPERKEPWSLEDELAFRDAPLPNTPDHIAQATGASVNTGSAQQAPTSDAPLDPPQAYAPQADDDDYESWAEAEETSRSEQGDTVTANTPDAAEIEAQTPQADTSKPLSLRDIVEAEVKQQLGSVPEDALADADDAQPDADIAVKEEAGVSESETATATDPAPTLDTAPDLDGSDAPDMAASAPLPNADAQAMDTQVEAAANTSATDPEPAPQMVKDETAEKIDNETGDEAGENASDSADDKANVVQMRDGNTDFSGNSLTAKIAALETAIGNISDTWEPDTSGEDAFSAPQPLSTAWQDDVERDATGAQVLQNEAIAEAEVASDIAENMEFAKAGQTGAATAALGALYFAAKRPDEGAATSQPVQEKPTVEAAKVAEPQVEQMAAPEIADDFDTYVDMTPSDAGETDAPQVSDAILLNNPILPETPAVLQPQPVAAEPQAPMIDEDMLRDLVSDIVREELQGALGERITRNVRKLVRREIHRALTAQELE